MKSLVPFPARAGCIGAVRRHPLSLGGAALCIALAGCGGGGGGSGASAGVASFSAPTTATLSGTVLTRSGAPLAGVTVTVAHLNNHVDVTAVTDANGRYSVAGLLAAANADYAVYVAKAGYGFSPKAGDPAASVTRQDFNGLYRTVIRFPTLPARAVGGADFIAYGQGDKLADLPRTGQSVSYASGDDFAARKGIDWPVQRFLDNGDGTVSDQLTGLVWMKNAGCFAPANWSAALAAANKLGNGACGLSDGSKAGDWRMPNVNELESLVDVSRSAPAIPAGAPFSNVLQTSAYWTSTTYTALALNAMAIRFSDGRWINSTDPGGAGFSNDKNTSQGGLWAVKSGHGGRVALLATGVYPGAGGGSYGERDDASLQLGVQLTSPRFIDNGNGTLTDTVTGLVWLKKADCIAASWNDALAAVNKLASGQCALADGSAAGQWRMPNRAEMLSLSDRAPTFPQASYFNGQYQASDAVTGPVIFERFIVSDYYWTSTTNAADPTQAWSVYSCDFGVYNLAKTERRYTLAVR